MNLCHCYGWTPLYNNDAACRIFLFVQFVKRRVICLHFCKFFCFHVNHCKKWFVIIKGKETSVEGNGSIAFYRVNI